MLELDGNLENVIGELRDVVSRAKGVEGVAEEITLEYIVQVKNESDKENVEAVGGLLSAQARRFGFSVEVIPFTKEEIEEGRKAAQSFIEGAATEDVTLSIKEGN